MYIVTIIISTTPSKSWEKKKSKFVELRFLFNQIGTSVTSIILNQFFFFLFQLPYLERGIEPCSLMNKADLLTNLLFDLQVK